jgi:hypothetical protein
MRLVRLRAVSVRGVKYKALSVGVPGSGTSLVLCERHAALGRRTHDHIVTGIIEICPQRRSGDAGPLQRQSPHHTY